MVHCSDLSVKIVDLEDTMQTTQLTGQKSGIRRATWHPNGDYLVCPLSIKVEFLFNIENFHPCQ